MVENKLPEKLVSWPEVNDSLKEKRLKLIEDLATISELAGKADFLPETRASFKGWYEDHMKNVVAKNQDPRFSGYLSRKGDLLLKLALIRSVSLSNDLKVAPEHLQWAGSRIQAIEGQMMNAFVTSSGTDERTMKAIINYISSPAGKGRVEKTILHREFSELIGETNLNRTLFQMVKGGELIYKTDGLKQFYEIKPV